MDLLVLIALLVAIYFGWMILATFRRMEAELKEIKATCSSGISTFKGNTERDDDYATTNKVAGKVISGLRKIMLSA